MYYSLISSMKKSSVDADAQAFITAAAITDATQQTAINTLVISLKNYGIWNKIKALYPMVGGTAASHKFNLKDPRDLDAAFRLTFSGGWTHSSTGALPNGTNAYADTYFNSLINFTSFTNIGISYYSRINSNGTEVEFGSANNILIEIRTSGTTYGRVGGLTNSNSFSDSNSLGFYNFNRIISGVEKGYKNGVLKSTVNIGITTFLSNKNYLGAWNNNSIIQYYSKKECAFATIGDGLTDTEASNFYTAVQAYQTNLSRQL